MAVLTKPDLAIERTMQQIPIDHVKGTRGNLTLGYYIVKNRGPDDANKTLEQGQDDERKFFSNTPWSALKSTGRAGIGALKERVRELLVDLIKKEFPQLKADIAKELSTSKSQLEKMGPSRSDQYTQRAYLNNISEQFQTLARDALSANYTGNSIFDERHELRLVTRIVEASEKYSDIMWKNGHTRPFTNEPGFPLANGELRKKVRDTLDAREVFEYTDYPDLEEIFDAADTVMPEPSSEGDIMEYIKGVHRNSRGQDLGTVSWDASKN